MIPRKFLPELIGMNLYQTGRGEYFYAWNHKHAITKRPNELIYFITSHGKRILVANHQTNGDQHV